MDIFRRFASGGTSSPADLDVGGVANERPALSFFFTMTPFSAFLADTSFLGAGNGTDTLVWSSLLCLDGAGGFDTTGGGGLLRAFSLAATALGGNLMQRHRHSRVTILTF